jgi:hypothetical protein
MDRRVVPWSWLRLQPQQMFPAFTFTGAAPGEDAMLLQASPSQGSSSLAPAFLLCAATQLTHNSSVEISTPASRVPNCCHFSHFLYSQPYNFNSFYYQ